MHNLCLDMSPVMSFSFSVTDRAVAHTANQGLSTFGNGGNELNISLLIKSCNRL